MPHTRASQPHARHLAFAGAILVAACSTGESGNQSTTRLTRGDTLIVRTTGPGVWESATLVEELRIGRLEGEDHEMFGRVSDLAPDGNGGVYIFDGSVPALRHYNAEGGYTGTFGREGAGPGEYRDASLGLAVLGDGRVIMRDPRNARINVYSPAGESLDSWPVASGLFTSNSMVVDTAGEIWLKIMLGSPEPDKPWPIGSCTTAGRVSWSTHWFHLRFRANPVWRPASSPSRRSGR